MYPTGIEILFVFSQTCQYDDKMDIKDCKVEGALYSIEKIIHSTMTFLQNPIREAFLMAVAQISG